MAALTADDVTVTLVPQDRELMGIALKVSYPTIAFGDGSKTYPTGGVPMPAISKFGMNKAIKFVTIMPACDGYIYKWDLSNHKLMMFYGDYSASADGVLVEVANTVAPPATSIKLKIEGN